MATKGQKQKKYTDELIELIVTERIQKGIAVSKLSRKYDVPEGTIETWAYKYRHKGAITRQKRGRPKVEENQDYKEKYEILKKYIEFLEEVGSEKK